ncbi:MAG: saccharopine dehydrogenase NADP-binding domain-containing protein [Gammaproteobacteria bacterium]|nr:saccharopine dehydrogenase NADP-binding domain-containing protein [Gammaproteobacteria bacterium]MBT8151896.1 saccharopine dehydrogenase NADP-binding domain-containing protein [Gammaproteobacteria bacterium]NND40228.1 saccharopine dehydrogenase [Pseudomonadales bacterium]NNL11112.1 saccharopine dehydrogenase [Pseudomonadales bacterium]NNM12466.1 saccharopine dehydrogenase [Pseudomonadales bacterium]
MGDVREFDVVIWGASGFTGRLVAEYYLAQYGASGELRWAMAGRNEAKLKAVQKEIGAEGVPLILADSHDRASLDAMVARTRTILTTVGPYAQYGDELLAACVAGRAHYCDLSGEPNWMRRTIDQHHEAARDNGVCIVHCCGFDSIPSDMGVYYLQQQAKAKKGEFCKHIKYRLIGMSGGFSGGTLASLDGTMAEAKADPDVRRMLLHPYGLNPRDAMDGPDGRDQQSVVYDEDAGQWTSPFIMALINTRVVRRSNALADFAYGKDFRYDESVLTGDGIAGRAKGMAAALSVGVLMLDPKKSLLRRTIDKFLPDPGEGPSREKREAGFFAIRLIGLFADGTKMEAKVKGDRDPGYGSTSKMLGESAVCLALDGDKLPGPCGVLTPSTAMGEALLERLQQNAGLRFELG